MAAPIYIPTNSARGLPFLHSYSHCGNSVEVSQKTKKKKLVVTSFFTGNRSGRDNLGGGESGRRKLLAAR